MSDSSRPSDPAAPPEPDNAGVGSRADVAAGGFAVHVVEPGPDRLPDDYDDVGGAWSRLLATAQLGDALVTDDDIEGVALGPLTLVLTTEAGGRLAKAPIEDRPFVVTLDGVRLFAGTVIFRHTARALRHPLIHRSDERISVNLRVVPSIGASSDSPLTTPAPLLEHFEREGKLLAAGTRPSPRTLRRRLVAEIARGDTPGAPIEQVEARCDDETRTCALARWTRRPGTPAGRWVAERAVALPLAEFDALWATAISSALFVTLPQALASAGRKPGPPSTRLHFTIEAERLDTTVVANDQAWNTPSLVDSRVAPYFAQAEELGRRLVPEGSVR